jgi:hypothetical protein
VELNAKELSWDGCVNARDLGGLGRIRPGAVVRMEAPIRLTEAGWAAACGATPGEIIADYLLSYDRLKQMFDEVGARDQLAAVTELLASRGTTIEASLTSTIASLQMPDFLLENGLSGAELAALHTRLTT